MLIDDDVDFQNLVKIALSNSNLHISFAKTIDEAYLNLKSFSPSIIFVDTTLGFCDGPTLIKKLFCNSKKRPRIIGISNHSKELVYSRYDFSFFDDFFQKPMGFKKLRSALESHIFFDKKIKGRQIKQVL